MAEIDYSNMRKVEIPFMPEFEQTMFTGKKSATTRTKRYGYTGDYFEAFGRAFILTEVYPLRLGDIAFEHYLEEGFNSDFEFRKCWERLHPRKGYVPDQRVYFHKFKPAVDCFQFHIHELMGNGKCRICGCDPRPYQDTLELH